MIRLSLDDQFYKNEHGIIGWIDQRIMLLARDVAIFLRWLTGKQTIDETINYLWYLSIIVMYLNIFMDPIFIVTNLFAMMFTYCYIKRWGLFGYIIQKLITGEGTKTNYITKCSSLVMMMAANVIYRIPPASNIYSIISYNIFLFTLLYYTRVQIPPPKRKTAPEKIKELLKKLKPIPKPLTNPTS